MENNTNTNTNTKTSVATSYIESIQQNKLNLKAAKNKLLIEPTVENLQAYNECLEKYQSNHNLMQYEKADRDQIIAYVKERLEKGETLYKIAQDTGVSYYSLHYHCTGLGERKKTKYHENKEKNKKIKIKDQ